MVSKRIQKALLGNSAIRAMFVEGKAMAEKYGALKLFLLMDGIILALIFNFQSLIFN